MTDINERMANGSGVGNELAMRPAVGSLEKILGVPFKVLDAGFVRVVDYMGSDESVVQAARVSYGAGTKRLQDDRALIRYLMRHSHTTPFEMCEIKLHVRAPMDVWRQWIRHRTASVNEYSTRYSVAIDAAQQTPSDQWRAQSVENKQGSLGFLDRELGQKISEGELELHRQARAVYEERLKLGVAREQARKDLPLCTYTEAYWKIDLHNLLHFLRLRLDAHAQEEIRKYAEAIADEIMPKWVPFVWEAFIDFQHLGLRLSRIEKEVFVAVVANLPGRARSIAESAGLINLTETGALARNREREELEIKLRGLGLAIPW